VQLQATLIALLFEMLRYLLTLSKAAAGQTVETLLRQLGQQPLAFTTTVSTQQQE